MILMYFENYKGLTIEIRKLVFLDYNLDARIDGLRVVVKEILQVKIITYNL